MCTKIPLDSKSSEITVSDQVEPTDLYIYILDAVLPIHVVSNHEATDKLTTQDGGMFTN